MRLPNLPRLAAKAVRLVVVEYQRMDQPRAPAPPQYAEQSTTGAVTQVAGEPRRRYRETQVTAPYATGGIGFTGDPR